MIRLYDEKTKSDVSELWWKEKPKKSRTKNPPMPSNHKKTIYDTGYGIDIYRPQQKGKRPRPIACYEYSALFESVPQNNGLTIVGGHGIRTELVEELKRDPRVIRAYENQKTHKEMVLAQASLYQPSPWDWGDEPYDS